ncbi:MAG TPA: mechanosensitive ion channel family protein [Acidimicrobiales bacterium]|nr:mechanosensitive ion channel family protein [Acidimicrobiales bacterium]
MGPLPLASAPVATSAVCGSGSDAVCAAVYRLTGSEVLARSSESLVAKPAKIVLILVLALLTVRLVRRMIRRFTRSVGTTAAGAAGTLLHTTAVRTPRAAQRAETIAALGSSVVTVTVWAVAVLMVLGELGLELGPLLAGAGIVGVAVGFGAQNLVRDFLSGIFMLIEDQYGVGDVIDAGPATGTVEGISLRTTRLRDIHGNVWHIPNGVIERVSNKSQEWSRALLDVPVAYDADTDHAAAVIKRAADEAWHDEAWTEQILAEPEVWGVEAFGDDAVMIRLVVKTRPNAQWKVARHLRRRIKLAFDGEGIEIPFPQRTVWHKTAGPGSQVDEHDVVGQAH